MSQVTGLPARDATHWERVLRIGSNPFDDKVPVTRNVRMAEILAASLASLRNERWDESHVWCLRLAASSRCAEEYHRRSGTRLWPLNSPERRCKAPPRIQAVRSRDIDGAREVPAAHQYIE